MKRMVAFTLAACLGTVPAGVSFADLPDPNEGTFLPGSEIRAVILKDFIRFDPQYVAHRQRFGDRLDRLAKRLAALQADGNEMECSNQIYLEAKWLYHYTASWDRLERRLDDFVKSLEQPDQVFATRQSAETGLWGICYEQSFMKLEATAIALIELEMMGETPQFAVNLPPPFDTPLVAFEHFRDLLVSDIARTGVDHRGELGNITTIASLTYFKNYLQGYLNNDVEGLPRNEGGTGAKTQEYTQEFSRIVQAWQDPATGYWGPSYWSDGHLYKSADLSYTFHIISYRRGNVDHWPEIVETTMAIENEPYPFGWKHEDSYVNHNNYDVAKIFRYGWPHMSPEQKRRAASKIRDMLHWTLSSSLQDDGSFQTVPAFFSSVGADFYFGVSFLQTIGFWDESKRFWSRESFPEANAVCTRIKAKLVAMALKTHESDTALTHLENAC
jgi:hypothetical protein